MRKFKWLSYAALITSLYPILYYQISKKYEQDYIAVYGHPSLPYEPLWFVLCFISPFLSLAITYLGKVQNEDKKETGEKEENPWMYRISIIIIILTVFLYACLLWK
ncbi:hypothetical protein P4U07_25905 [Bacillus mycoides]|uniref:hypothetical protein n=1 Tax=Bacillus mycoides TaxID=1405 RepID=UPI002E211679|nr:hypothetical protein [Bacillus mycoides]